MSADTFRFLHAADLHLEQPVFGLSEVPDHLSDLLIDAPFQAAERVFEAATAENVDFLLLAGDIVNHKTASPRAIDFLLRHFRRLDEHKVQVYWCSGRSDRPDLWPQSMPLPSNVHVFGPGQAAEVIHHRDGEPLLTIVGRGARKRAKIRAADFGRSDRAGFSLAMTYGRGDSKTLASTGFDYWALGGRHRRRTLFSSPGVAHYPGSPQGRCPDETGPHGCTLVRVDAAGQVHTQSLATDVLRWHTEHVRLDKGATRDDLESQMGDRVLNLMSDAAGRAMLVSWRISAGGELGFRLRRRGLAEDLRHWLRSEFADSRCVAWTVSVEAEAPAELPAAWHEEDTILGDFLRAAQSRQTQARTEDEADSPIADEPLAELPDAAAKWTYAQDGDQLWREVAALGADLLRGEDAA